VKERKFQLGTWEIFGADAEEVARRLLPYSLVKREQLELFLEGRSISRGKGSRLTEDEKILLEEYAYAIKEGKQARRVEA
jgi:hypothetical protein